MKSFFTILALFIASLTVVEAQAATCKVELRNGRGRLLETFPAYGNNMNKACKKARRQCNDTIVAGYYRARVQTCEIVEQLVTRTCTATLRTRYGSYITSRMGTATGVRGTGVKARACDNAMRSCQTADRFYGSRGSYCSTDGAGSVSSRGPVVTRPNYPRPSRDERRRGRGHGRH